MLMSLFLTDRKLLAYPDLESLSNQYPALWRRVVLGVGVPGLGATLVCLIALMYSRHGEAAAAAKSWAPALLVFGLTGAVALALTRARGLGVGAVWTLLSALLYLQLTTEALTVPGLLLALLTCIFVSLGALGWTQDQVRRLQPLAQASGTPCEDALQLTRAYPACRDHAQSVLAQGRQLLQVDLAHLEGLRVQAEAHTEHQLDLTWQANLGTSPEAEARYDRQVSRIKLVVLSVGGLTALGFVPALAVPVLMALPLAIGALLGLLWRLGDSGLMPAWRHPILVRDSMMEYLAGGTPGGQFLRTKRAKGEVLLVQDLRTASNMDSANSAACRELHLTPSTAPSV